VDYVRKRSLLAEPRHLVQQLGTGLAAAAVRSPSNALYGRGLLGGYYQLIVQGQRSYNASIDSDDHAEAKTELFEAIALSWTRVGIMLALLFEA
jgi:hypothetical protein